MKVTLFGAAQDVTGSCYLVTTDRARVLVDCGMFQGSTRTQHLNYIPKAIIPDKLDAVVLTHGHLDHCGRLPLLAKSGYKGPIYSTPGTLDITSLILHDAAHVQANDLSRTNRKRRRAGLKDLKALFDVNDVERVLKHFRTIPYEQPFSIADGINCKFVDAGHILGAASIIMEADEKTLVFSGDLGSYGVPIMNDPSSIDGADVVFMESTYGDRDHRSLEETLAEFRELITESAAKGGTILIPTFAVGRTQQILYYLAKLTKEGSIPSLPVYLDSPMAIAATEIYARHGELMDKEGREFLASGGLNMKNLKVHPCLTTEESQALNAVSGPCIILAGAGMCTAGRILHHLKHNLWQPNSALIIVGYQSKGSLGRALLEGAKRVKIMGETIVVRATVKSLGGFSAHAGQSELLRWFSSMSDSHPRVVLSHGEPHPINELSYCIENRFGIKCDAPKLGDTLVI